MSVDCQCLLLLADLSSDGSITVLKSPPIITGLLEKFEMEEKKVWKKAGLSKFGP